MNDSTLAEMLRAARMVDLSLTLADDLPCSWPGAVRFRHTIDHWFADVAGPQPLRNRSGTPYHTSTFELDEHTGTHFDAPAHFIPPPGSGLPNAGRAGLVTAEAVDLSTFIGPAVVVDVGALVGLAPNGASPRIEPGLLDEFENEHGAIGGGDIVLFRTGWDSRYLRGAAGNRYLREPLVFRSEPAWPAPSSAAVEWLLAREVRCIGTDGASMGPADAGAPTHLAALSAGMLFVEGLAHLDELPVRGATFVFLPLPVEGGSGSPGRAIAIVPGS